MRTTRSTPTATTVESFAISLSPTTHAIWQQPADVRELNDRFISTPRPHALLITNHGYAGPTFPPASPDSGGQITYVNRLAENLVEQGFKVTVATRSFTPDEQFAAFGNRQGAAFFVGRPYARYVYIPGIDDNFLPKEQVFADLPAIGANLAAFVADEAGSLKKQPWEYISWINSHYWDGGVVGQLLVRAWQRTAPKIKGLNRHAWNAHSIGTLKEQNMLALPSDARAQKLFKAQHAAMNFPMREYVERSLIGGAVNTYNSAIALYPHCPPAPVLVYTSQEIHDHIHNLDAPESARLVAFPPGTDVMRYYPRDNITHDDIQALFSYLHDIVYVDTMERMHTNPQSLNVVVEASRMDATKRKEIVIKAMKYMPDDTICFITGKPDKKGVHDGLVRLIKELELWHRVFMLGMVPDELMGPLMSLPFGKGDDKFRTAIGVSASRMEGWGMAVMDMNAGGMPLIASSATPYAVRIKNDYDAAIVIPMGEGDEPMAYAQAMRSLIEDTARAYELGRLGLAAAQRFTWPGLVNNFVAEMNARFGEGWARASL
jgi:glycosyltransferase involved in cell wall biosynthesis